MSTANANWPRVSTILKVLGDHYADVPSGVLATAAERGENLHQLCLTYLASLDGLCAEPVPTPPYVNAYTAFQAWVKENHVCPIAIEQESVCEKYHYRGTPDALVWMGVKHCPVLIDLKFTASVLRINRVQVQAYHKLDLYSDAKQMMLVHIQPKDGQLKQETIKSDPRDWAAFMNALSVYRWRQS